MQDVLDIPVCPGCGAPALGDVRCSNCGTRLEGSDPLPTRREWELLQELPRRDEPRHRWGQWRLWRG